MLIAYIQAAMREAHYELMENGRFYGEIPSCEGVWGEGATLEECRDDLEGALQDWVVVKLRFGHSLPVIASIDINPRPEMAHAETD
ncbi:MAG: type II toxin-antitoxin system HicB family antitoxin [Verrucomicrobia subdivision 3 bacterium]|nr:type II toxin-antitoxin system HicB family antitoxin [Limisphaerales bacterium]